MTVGSLFAGIGAFDLGFQQAGFETIWACEIDANCRKLLASKFPKARLHDDVTTFNTAEFECPDVIAFGSPCQDLSVAGKRSGINGERSGLFFHATRIIRGFVGRRLRFALWENVPGVLNSNGPRDFAAVLGTLAQCGALDVGWRVLDCQWFGLAQRRKRVFLVADFGGRRTAEILSLAQSLQRDTPPRREKGQRTSTTIGGCSNGGGANGPGRDVDSCESIITIPDCARRLRAQSQASHREDSDTYVLAHVQANAEIVNDGSPSLTCQHEAPIAIAFAQNQRQEVRTVAVAGSVSAIRRGDAKNETLLAFSSKDSGDDATNDLAPTLRSQNFKDSHMNGGGQVAIAFKPNQGAKSRSLGAQEEISPTLEGAAGGNNKPAVQPVGSMVRRLTPTECERLMGFPDGWTSDFSDSVRYRMLGNSLAVPVAYWIAKGMFDCLSKDK